jgi:hypothetical protein
MVVGWSKAFAASEWCRYEHLSYLFRNPTDKQRKFIPLRLDDCEIKDTLQQFAYIDWRGKDKGEYARLLSSCQGAATNKPDDKEQKTSDCVRAGEVFKERFENDPELRAAMERMRPKMEAMAQQLSQQLREYGEYFEASFGEPAPQSIEDWVRLAARAGLDANWIREGKWSPREVAPIIEGYLQRVREGNSQR